MRGMCTAIVSVEPGGPLLLAGIRDELADRAWLHPAGHWPEFPGVVGGRDLLAGGTWLAIAPAGKGGSGRGNGEAGRGWGVSCVLNGRGRLAPPGSRRSRGVLPLEAVSGGRAPGTGLAGFDPFHLLTASPGTVTLSSWDGERYAGQELAPGLHMIVNSGLAARAGDGYPEQARIEHFLPRLAAAPRPEPRPGLPVALAWGSWLPLMNGDGLDPGDPRALIVRRDLGGGRIWGTTSVSLVALSPSGPRYDFSGTPGDPSAWAPVPLPGAAA